MATSASNKGKTSRIEKEQKEESTPVKQRETGATEHLGRQGCDESSELTQPVWPVPTTIL